MTIGAVVLINAFAFGGSGALRDNWTSSVDKKERKRQPADGSKAANLAGLASFPTKREEARPVCGTALP
jgi:hypothetical protein